MNPVRYIRKSLVQGILIIEYINDGITREITDMGGDGEDYHARNNRLAFLISNLKESAFSN